MVSFRKALLAYASLGGLAGTLMPEAEAGLVNRIDATQFDGAMQDLGVDRMLFITKGGVLTLEDRATGLRTAIPAVESRVPLYGYLVPGGTIFVAKGETALDVGVYAYAGGTLRQLGSPDAWSSLKVRGNFVIWNGATTPELDAGSVQRLNLYNLGTGEEQTISTTAGNVGNAVTATGIVTYWDTSYHVRQFADGVTRDLAGDDTHWNVLVDSDGPLTVFRKQDPCCVDQHYQIMLASGGVETPLADASLFEPRPGANYQVNDGWVAYTAGDADGVQQVWLRSPGGVATRVTTGTQSARLDLLGPGGHLTYLVGDNLYVAGNPTPVTTGFGAEARSFWLDDQLWLSAENVLRPDPGTPPPAVPLPAAAWLFASAAGLSGLATTLTRRRVPPRASWADHVRFPWTGRCAHRCDTPWQGFFSGDPAGKTG